MARALRYLARLVATSLYYRQVQYITLQPIGEAASTVAASGAAAKPDIEFVIVDSVAAVDAIARAIPAAFRDSVDELKRRVAHGCVVCLARRRGHGVIGYELAEQAVFSALGRRHAVTPEMIFSHWAEVLPAYRGQRVHARLFATRDAYFRRRGGEIVCGVVDPRNRASLKALGRARSAVVGTVTRISLLKGLVVWETPREHIEVALRLGTEAGRRQAPMPAGYGGPRYDRAVVAGVALVTRLQA